MDPHDLFSKLGSSNWGALTTLPMRIEILTGKC